MQRVMASILLSFAMGQDSSVTSEWDYCSIPHSMAVYDEAHDVIYEVFKGYNVPISARTCPFHQTNLDFFKN